MRRVLEECPSCGGDVEVTRVSCTTCETEVTGRFAPCRFCRLPPETAHFLELFVKNRGNVKEMVRELEISYWTIRNRINDLITEMGFESEEKDEIADQRQQILAKVNRGELTAGEAAELLSSIR